MARVTSQHSSDRTTSRRTALGATLGLSLGAITRIPPAVGQASQPADRPGGHNMLVFGEKTVFLSHFPMFQQMSRDGTHFNTIHRFQLILEAQFQTPQGQDAMNLYQRARQQRPEVGMYSLQPEQFVLQELFTPTGGGRPRRSFTAGVFFNHLERGGEAVAGLENATVQIKQVLHVHEFRPGHASPEDLEYILFGKVGELFLAHLIATPADFDQVLPVNVTGRSFSDEELNRGFRVRLRGRPNSASDRLRETNQRLIALVRAADVPIDRDDRPGVNEREISIEPRREIYFEESELRTLPIFGQTVLEREAGF